MMRQIAYLFACIGLLLATGSLRAQASHILPIQLTTELRSNPIGIATANPMFAWTLQSTTLHARNLQQAGYRLRVATSRDDLQRHSGLIWDSGRVASSTYWQRPYGGPPLKSRTTYFWQVQTWTSDGSAGPWSEISQFTTALLSETDWRAHWIAAAPDTALTATASEYSGEWLAQQPPPLPIFRREFKVTKPIASALLFVAGLGQYEVHLNGSDVTKTVLNSGWTDYRKTVLYDTYDVARLLHGGANTFGVLLGNGMYNVEGVKGHYTKFTGSFGQPKCLLQLEVRYADGTSDSFLSDASWQTHSGPIVYSSTYGGEVYDARELPAGWDNAGFSADGWQHALEVGGPGGRLAASRSAPMIVAQTYRPIRTTHPRPGVTVYDLGENFSGWPRIIVEGSTGLKIQMLPGELLNSDGTVTQKSAAATPQDPVIYSYVLRGGGPETWHPRFAYYSFRYVQVTVTDGPPPKQFSLLGDFVHADAPIAGRFSSSNDLFQRIHVLIDRAVLSNLASVLTDCPSREKLGWLEQTYLNASTLMLNYDVTGLYEKMSDDMRDAQLPNGLVPSIAPEYVAFVDDKGNSNAFRDSPEWGSAVILSPWALYQYTGDIRPLTANYPAMQRYVAYLESKSQGGLLNYGLGDWYDIGPKPPGPSQLTSRYVTATGVYFEDLTTLARIAALLGHVEDVASYTQKAAAVRDAFNAKLFHPETNQYDRGSQTANALPLALGLVPPGHLQAVLANLVSDIHAHKDHVTSGDIGFHYVVRALTNNGRSDVLFAMFSRTDSPSYGYQLERGATTLTEAWDANPESSQNHFMLGHGEEWFYRGVAGLHVDMAKDAREAVLVQPSFLASITSASASYQTPMGLVDFRWKHVGTQASVDLIVPVGALLHLRLPAQTDWREGDTRADRAIGVVNSSRDNQVLDLILGSGTFHFRTVRIQEPFTRTTEGPLHAN
jgi:alpha-L-rhamnosidase